ncbi:glycosyltransferase family 4 protein [Flavobacterium amniphilum]|uniref:glycosyltransferase family 4 protein n=1 Tax=Flavobacterium amniphilum TaxID=1834035 RepID=UPI00202A64F0|nr:glycosyltransferase [Flavobacterium amniphilum]MCL9805094.1 glycosyltransferase family 4 protein [Flavobacterium amniphilum]
MKFLIVSNAPIIQKQKGYFAYSPYVKEMKMWANHAGEIAFCCPQWHNERGLLVSEIPFSFHKNFCLSDFDITSFKAILKALIQIPFNLLILFRAMIWADHIHLRCPGNVGLLASIVQIFFPWKKKTAKYAGNWDPKAQQPWTYKLQRKILSNTFLTHNMQVLVYGEWVNQSDNIKPFFTATYSESDKKTPVFERKFDGRINFLFVGMLTAGKRPLYAVKIVEELHKRGYDAHLDVLGEGNEKDAIVQYCLENNLSKYITLHGNQEQTVVKELYKNSHFLILPSKSEGWPKVIAEAMFWGSIPLSTAVSCVSYMLDNGNRGIILTLDIHEDVQSVVALLNNEGKCDLMSQNALQWSRKYTIDYFESEIAKLVM